MQSAYCLRGPFFLSVRICGLLICKIQQESDMN